MNTRFNLNEQFIIFLANELVSECISQIKTYILQIYNKIEEISKKIVKFDFRQNLEDFLKISLAYCNLCIF